MAKQATQHRRALVLAGGGARGAYEAGVLAYVFEHVYPRLPPGFEFDIFSGTSVGAVHAAFSAATANADPGLRAKQLLEAPRTMRLSEVLHLTLGDLLGIPLRALGLRRARGSAGGSPVLGGLVDVAPLERIVEERIPWSRLRDGLRHSTPKALCISCTEVRTGRVTVFMDGPLADGRPWAHDPNAGAIETRIDARHVRASASIPFLFPAVLIEGRYYVEGGLRMNTPLSPALRLSADRILVVALKKRPRLAGDATPCPEQAVTQPAFLLGKVLDALTLDQLEYEIHHLELVNALIARGETVYGDDFLARINPAVQEQRGAGYRRVETAILRPSQDLGALAAESHRRSGGPRELGLVSALLTQATRRGVPEEEADLLSYLLFDRCYTEPLLELGRADASARADEIVALLMRDEGETS
ncbi:MAG: patatin-like phospholipase family protein [Myxococcota bacterium]